jgi:Zn-dependent M16 (insulinase) family peptidase
MGTQVRDHRELAHEIELFTGGLSASATLVTSPSNLDSLESHVLFSTMALERNIGHMFELLSEIVTKPSFENKELLRTLILQVTRYVNKE